MLARVDEKTLVVHARALRDAGVLDKGGRGRSAIEVDHVYLAKLLTSRMGTDKPARAVEAYERFSGLQLSTEWNHHLVESMLPDPDHRLIDFMTVICDPAVTLSSEHQFEVAFIGSAIVEVRTEQGTLIYIDREYFNSTAAELSAVEGDGETRSNILGKAAASMHSLIGITESRSFTSDWLEFFKGITLRGGGNEIEPAAMIVGVDP